MILNDSTSVDDADDGCECDKTDEVDDDGDGGGTVNKDNADGKGSDMADRTVDDNNDDEGTEEIEDEATMAVQKNLKLKDDDAEADVNGTVSETEDAGTMTALVAKVQEKMKMIQMPLVMALYHMWN